MELFINQFGYLAVTLLIFLECVFPPIPSEVVLPLAGFTTTVSTMTLPGVIVAATIGSLIGAFVFYAVGRLLSRERLMSLFSKRFMRVLGFKPSDIERIIDWFDRKGQISVLICRCIPGLRSLISIPAGTAKMGLAKFTVYTTLGSLAWNALLCSLGALAGNAWAQVSDGAQTFSNVVMLVLLAICVVIAVWWIVKRMIPAIRNREEC
ncbi:MAG: DedA family protein [Coriobacteriales bacterium]|jgi:membrane protein DedA with SNARE-associated domain